MSYPPGPYEGSPDWQSQQPGWPGPQPGWPGQQPGWQGQQPGWQGQQPGWQGQREPDNYLVWAILSTVLCCLPLGIVSIVYSTKVSGLWSQGRYAEAQAASENAKKWAIISAIVQAVVYVIAIVLYLFVLPVAISNLPSTTSTTFSTY
jgi:hypothetical protein